MRYKTDNDLHIHTWVSPCSADTGMTPERILDYAAENGFSDVCITDHFWDETVPGASPFIASHETFAHLAKNLPLPKREGIRLMFGCECELDRYGALSISRDTFDKFDFVAIPINHFHMDGFTIAEEDFNRPDRVAKLWVERFLHVLSMDLPFHKVGFAHLSCELMATSSRTSHIEVCDLISDEELHRCFSLAAKLGAGIELNFETFFEYTESELERIMRMYRAAKSEGCRFYFGSDAHHPSDLARSKEKFERVVDFLSLEETDKFKLE